MEYILPQNKIMVFPLMSVIATLPSSTQFIASIGEWSSPLFNDLLPFGIFAIGILLGVGLISFIIIIVSKVVDKIKE